MHAKKFFATREQLVADYAILRSATAVAKKHDVSKKLILRYMARWGVPRKQVVSEEAVRQLVAANAPAEEIARVLQTSPANICRIARKLGVKVHDPYHRGVIDHNGYRTIHRPDHPFADSKGCVGEHRLIVERNLGHLLSADEIVHHANGVKADNRLENLIVMTDFEHRSHHRKKGDCGRKRKQYP